MGGSDVRGARTDADGHYEVSRLGPGDYTVEFSDCSNDPIGVVTEYYDDVADEGDATAVTVNASTATTGIDAGVAIDDTDRTPAQHPD